METRVVGSLLRCHNSFWTKVLRRTNTSTFL
ncbi:UNVERIFIED_CONTAM: hypothetical protein GTU68_018963 [Idotea baltica]|nr:hypothetical protein [Idotea baltica]